MSVYEIVPSTQIVDSKYRYDNIKLSDCTRFCNDMDDCAIFSWSDSGNGRGTCLISPNIEMNSLQNSTSYIKKGHPSYWPIILFIALALLVLFYTYCSRCKKL